MHFFDTYAMVAILRGDPQFEGWKRVPGVCHQMNQLEALVYLMKSGVAAPGEVLNSLGLQTVEAGFDDLQEAARLKLAYSSKQRPLSYVDALGYALARRLGFRFLTGDRGFRDLPGVEFVAP